MIRPCHPTVFTAIITLVFAIFASSPAAKPLDPEDILIVCNDNFPGSRGVAEYYAAKRHVPKTNILCLDLPKTETIPRSVFDKRLLPPLRKTVTSLRQAGRRPILLLVYGVPLKVGATPSQAYTGKKQQRLHERRHDLELLIHSLTQRLSDLSGQNQEGTDKQAPAEGLTPPQLLEKSQAIAQMAFRFIANPRMTKSEPGITMEIQSLLFRLVGTEPYARLLTADRADKQWSPNDDLLIKLHTVIRSQLVKLPFLGVTVENELEAASLVRTASGLLGELAFWEEQLMAGQKPMTSAAVDSELTMLTAGPYQTKRWLPNPFHGQFDRLPGIAAIRERTIMTARIDGPSPDHARRLIDDGLWAEEHGLRGKFYIDARGLSKGKNDFYALYDDHLHRLHDILKKNSTIPVVFDNNKELFKPGSSPNAALYCGWYSLGKYIDAFTWQRGAVGFHVASSEASTLRKTGSQVWTKRMIEEGIAATLGPVQEPFLQSFPLPDVFFPLLLSGQLPLIQVYYRSTPFVSWRQVLIGDPLYNPFKNKPALTPKN